MRSHLPLIAAFLITSAPAIAQESPAPASSPAPAQPPAQDPDVTAGNQAFGNEDWPAATKAYKASLAKGNTARIIHFRLGYALHMQKQYDEALKHHLLAAQINNRALRIDALYNAACANALLGHKDEALRFFQHAIDAGFSDTTQVEKDTDLDPLRGDDRFKSLVAGIGKTPRLDQQLDFLLGSWSNTSTPGPTQVSISFSRPLPGSHGIVTTIKTANAARTGLLMPIAAERTWLWTSADGMGTTLTLTGKTLPSGGAQFEGRERSIGGEGVKLRLTWTPSTEGFTEKVEVTEDGSTWRPHHETAFKKQQAVAESSETP